MTKWHKAYMKHLIITCHIIYAVLAMVTTCIPTQVVCLSISLGFIELYINPRDMALFSHYLWRFECIHLLLRWANWQSQWSDHGSRGPWRNPQTTFNASFQRTVMWTLCYKLCSNNPRLLTSCIGNEFKLCRDSSQICAVHNRITWHHQSVHDP